MKPIAAIALIGLCAAAVAGSAAAQPGGGRRAILYEYPNFQGRSYVVYGRNDGLGPTGFEDEARSARFEGDWTICEDDNYQGHCETVSGDVPDLGRYGLSGEISSLRAEWGGDRRYGGGGYGGYGDRDGDRWRDNRGGRTATLYEYPDFQGRSYTVYDYNRGLGSTGFEDRAMSGRFDGPWMICEDDDFQGHCETVSGGVRNLDRLNLGHEVSSLRATRGYR
ncbi:MAG: hypothetical protein JSR86_13575 [Proteobacteria bacterium]|nr:hypothetical protein [Pseudomonadota bacterium]